MEPRKKPLNKPHTHLSLSAGRVFATEADPDIALDVGTGVADNVVEEGALPHGALREAELRRKAVWRKNGSKTL